MKVWFHSFCSVICGGGLAEFGVKTSHFSKLCQGEQGLAFAAYPVQLSLQNNVSLLQSLISEQGAKTFEKDSAPLQSQNKHHKEKSSPLFNCI